MNYNYIKQGDCLDLMRILEDNCVDVSFTSPPYNDSGNKNESIERKEGTHRKYLEVETRSDWFEWQCEVIDEMLRVTKKLVLYNVAGLKNNRVNVYKLIGRYCDIIHDIVIWYKPNGTPTSTPHKISNTYEYLLLLKPNGVKGVDVNSLHYRNVIVKNTNTNKEYSKIHKAIMGKDFCSEVIKEFTKEGDIVLDPFLGLGTTGICCIEQNRKFIGFELNKVYCNIAYERLKEARLNLNKITS